MIKKYKNMKSIAVFCGSRKGNNPVYEQDTYDLGKRLAEANITLVYGGGGIGLMNVLANAVLEHGGKVIGVIPHFFNEKEVAHSAISEMICVESMSDRKTKIAAISDGFIALPGGIGTLDELFEMLVYSQLNLHNKPVGILNTNRFYNPLLSQLKKMKSEDFLYDIHHDMLFVEQSPQKLLEKMKHFTSIQNQDGICSDKT